MLRDISEILRNTVPDLFELSPPDKRVLAMEARDKEWPKICALLEINQDTEDAA